MLHMGPYWTDLTSFILRLEFKAYCGIMTFSWWGKLSNRITTLFFYHLIKSHAYVFSRHMARFSTVESSDKRLCYCRGEKMGENRKTLAVRVIKISIFPPFRCYSASPTHRVNLTDSPSLVYISFSTFENVWKNALHAELYFLTQKSIHALIAQKFHSLRVLRKEKRQF